VTELLGDIHFSVPDSKVQDIGHAVHLLEMQLSPLLQAVPEGQQAWLAPPQAVHLLAEHVRPLPHAAPEVQHGCVSLPHETH